MYVTVYANHSRTTSYSSRTLTETLALPSNASAIPTFTNTDNITWTVGDATLTYPTTYLQYLEFAGAPATTDDGQLCAQQTDASPIVVPTSTDAASFIYPSSNSTAGMPLPTALLEYLDSFPEISSQFPGDDLTECAPLKATALRRRAVAVPIQPAQPKRRFEGARTSANQASFITPLAVPGGNCTIYPRDTGYGTGTAPQETPPAASSSQASSTSEAQSTATTALPENTHTTAFVINSISGRSIVISRSGPAVVSPTTYPDDNPGPTTTPSTGGSSGGGTGDNNGGSNSGGSNNGGSNNGGSNSGGSNSGGSSAGGSGSGHNGSGSNQSGGNDGGSGSNGSGSGSNGGSNNGGSNIGSNDSGNDGGSSSSGGGSHDSNNGGSSSGGSGSGDNRSGSSGNEQSGGSGQGTQAPGAGTKAGSGPQATAAADSLPGGSSGSNTILSNLVGNIQTVANSGASPTEGSSSGGSQDLSNLLGNINSVAAQGGDSGSSQPTVNRQQDSSAATPSVFSVGDTVVSAGSDGTYSYDGQALAPGSTVMLGSGHQYTAAVLQTSGGSTQLVVGGKTIGGLQPGETAAGSASSQAVVTTNGHTITAVQTGGSLVLNDGSSTTTLPVGSAATFDGQTISAASSGALVMNGQAITLMVAQATAGAGEAVITAGGHTITAVQTAGSLVLKDGSSTVTLPAGSAATFEGQTISAVSSGALIVNGQTITSMAAQATAGTGEAVITAGGHTFTAAQIAGGSVVLEDVTSTMTVKDGSVATFEGQTVMIASDGSSVVIGGSTTVKLTSTATTSGGIGGYINSGLSGFDSPTVSATADGSSPSATSAGVAKSVWPPKVSLFGFFAAAVLF